MTSSARLVDEVAGRSSSVFTLAATFISGLGGLRLGFFVFASTLSVYLVTTPRSLAGGDSGELTTAAATLGVAHPPGYPLYVLIGHVFASIPVGEVAFRLNLMSAFFGALAAFLVYATVKELTRSGLSGIVAALSLAFSYHFWGQSLIAEVYTLDAALIAGVVYLLALHERRRSSKFLYLAFLLLGLSLANRPTTVLLLPGIVAWGFATGWRPDLRQSAMAACSVIPGLTLYLLIPLVGAFGDGYQWSVGYLATGEPLHTDLTSVQGFRWYVTAEIFHPLAGQAGANAVVAGVARLVRSLWSEFIGVGVVLGLLGAAAGFRHHRAFWLLTTLPAVSFGLFFATYGAIDKDQMLLPLYLLWALWIGLGTAAFIRLAEGGSHNVLVTRASKTLVLLVPVILLLSNFHLVNFANTRTVEDEALKVLTAAAPNAVVVGGWEQINALDYYQRVEGDRPDLALIASWPLTDESLHLVVEENLGHRPIYLLSDAPSLRKDYELVDAGLWFEIEAGPEEGVANHVE